MGALFFVCCSHHDVVTCDFDNVCRCLYDGKSSQIIMLGCSHTNVDTSIQNGTLLCFSRRPPFAWTS
jgi:hypothetical protein